MIMSMFFCMLVFFIVVVNIVNNLKSDKLYNEIKYHSDYIAISRDNRLYIHNESTSKVLFIPARLELCQF